MLRFMVASVVAMAGFAVTASSVNAQTGPVGGGQPNAGQKMVVAPQGGGMTAESLEQHFKQQGMQTKIITHKNGDSTVSVEVIKDSWKFTVEYLFIKNGGYVDVNVPLTPITQLPSQQGMALLKFGYEKYPLHFSMRPNGNMLTLEMGSLMASTLNVQQVNRMMENAIQTARETYGLWNPAGWNENGKVAQN